MDTQACSAPQTVTHIKLHLPDGTARVFALHDRDPSQGSLWEQIQRQCVDNRNRLFWVDSEGDRIIVESDAELRFALSVSAPLSLLHLYVEQAGTVGDRSILHPHIMCDQCYEHDIRGYRYKCVECCDYDLCARCAASGQHAFHIMLRLPVPVTEGAEPILMALSRYRDMVCAQYGPQQMLQSALAISTVARDILGRMKGRVAHGCAGSMATIWRGRRRRCVRTCHSAAAECDKAGTGTCHAAPAPEHGPPPNTDPSSTDDSSACDDTDAAQCSAPADSAGPMCGESGWRCPMTSASQEGAQPTDVQTPIEQAAAMAVASRDAASDATHGDPQQPPAVTSTERVPMAELPMGEGGTWRQPRATPGSGRRQASPFVARIQEVLCANGRAGIDEVVVAEVLAQCNYNADEAIQVLLVL